MATLAHRILALDDALPDNPMAYAFGAFTRYGDVSGLLGAIDSIYAIMRHGDEVEAHFDGSALPPPAPGTRRYWVVKTDLYYKELGTSSLVTPLPFHGMSQYPYADPEAYPTDEAHQDYLSTYNTRVYVP